MAILDTIKKGYVYFKTSTGYQKFLPRTLASLVTMNDGKNVENAITELNSNSISDIVKTSVGTAIKYANGYVEQFGRTVCQNVNGNVAQTSVYLPVPLLSGKSYSAIASKGQMSNSLYSLNATAFAEMHTNFSELIIGIHDIDGHCNSFNEAERTVNWLVKGFWK